MNIQKDLQQTKERLEREDMIHDLWKELRQADERIYILQLQIEDTQGLRCGMPQGIPHSGFGRPTESSAIRVAYLKNILVRAENRREMIHRKLDTEKARFEDGLLWDLLRDHFYSGFSWKKVAAIHGMKESAVKMRFSRFLKRSRGPNPPRQHKEAGIL